MRATELLYKRHGDTVFRYAWHLLGRREDAEDATQATFLAVHGALSGGTAVLESGAWVLRIARNECMGTVAPDRAAAGCALARRWLRGPRCGWRGANRPSCATRCARPGRRSAGLPVPEREAFVLREWLGFEAERGRLSPWA